MRRQRVIIPAILQTILRNIQEGEMCMATVKTSLIAASCGMILFGAISAHALSGVNGLAMNKLAANKLASNKLASNKLAANKLASNKLAANKLASNKLAANKLAANGINPNTLTTTVPSDNIIGMHPSDGFFFRSLSQNGLGKPSVDAYDF
jgi:hypothetical protein